MLTVTGLSHATLDKLRTQHAHINITKAGTVTISSLGHLQSVLDACTPADRVVAEQAFNAERLELLGMMDDDALQVWIEQLLLWHAAAPLPLRVPPDEPEAIARVLANQAPDRLRVRIQRAVIRAYRAANLTRDIAAPQTIRSFLSLAGFLGLNALARDILTGASTRRWQSTDLYGQPTQYLRNSLAGLAVRVLAGLTTNAETAAHLRSYLGVHGLAPAAFASLLANGLAGTGEFMQCIVLDSGKADELRLSPYLAHVFVTTDRRGRADQISGAISALCRSTRSPARALAMLASTLTRAGFSVVIYEPDQFDEGSLELLVRDRTGHVIARETVPRASRASAELGDYLYSRSADISLRDVISGLPASLDE